MVILQWRGETSAASKPVPEQCANMAQERFSTAPRLGALTPGRSNGSLRRWLHLWRWPAALVAGVVLWLALVAVAGAATVAYNFDLDHQPIAGHSMLASLQSIADPCVARHCRLQTGFTPRGP